MLLLLSSENFLLVVFSRFPLVAFPRVSEQQLFYSSFRLYSGLTVIRSAAESHTPMHWLVNSA